MTKFREPITIEKPNNRIYEFNGYITVRDESGVSTVQPHDSNLIDHTNDASENDLVQLVSSLSDYVVILQWESLC